MEQEQRFLCLLMATKSKKLELIMISQLFALFWQNLRKYSSLSRVLSRHGMEIELGRKKKQIKCFIINHGKEERREGQATKNKLYDHNLDRNLKSFLILLSYRILTMFMVRAAIKL